MVLPIVAGFYFGEIDALVAFLSTAFAFFGLGFVMNSLSQREDMDFKSSSIVITSAFILLGLIGSVPYMYLDVFSGDLFTRFTDSYFESVAGFTTGGFSFIADVDSLPQSLLLYRGMTQWIGGLGIIFILLAFFYNKQVTLEGIARVIGLERVAHGIKLVMSHVIVVYAVYAVVLAGVLYYVRDGDFVRDVSLVMSLLSTGGWTAFNDVQGLAQSSAFYIMIIGMILGAMNFFLHDKIMMGRIRGVFKNEMVVYLSLLAVGAFLFYMVSDLPIRDSVFHVVSASTTSGYTYVDVNALADAAKIVLIFLMFTGGMSFSTSGGVKVISLIMFLKSIPWIVSKFVRDSKGALKYEGHEFDDKTVIAYVVFPMAAVFVITMSTFIFTVYGHSITQSLFDSVAAYSLSGISTGVVTVAMPLELKWWVVLLMIIGRVELLTFLAFLRPRTSAGTSVTPYTHPLAATQSQTQQKH
jgi:trk system potassium uptake protein TrkH